jgi:hypothetical protein
MNFHRLAAFSALVCVGVVFGCVGQPDAPPSSAREAVPDKPPEKQPEAKKVELGKNIFLEVQGDRRRVLIQGAICLREGILEQLVTKKGTKEHEAIIAADIDARTLHLALTLAGAEPGQPVQWRPKFKPASGTTVKIFVEYYADKGKTVRVPAQQWIQHMKTKKDLPSDWVFAGSYLIPDPTDKTKKPYYAANTGDVICVSNFESALLDVPFDSPKDNDDLAYIAHTARIPPEKTPVTVILEPVLSGKK